MKHKHLTLSDRIEIELGITQGFSFRKIASIIEKDPSTVSKEINDIVSEGIHKGQHLHHIIVTHELSVSRSNEKTNHFYFGYTYFFLIKYLIFK